MVLESHKDNTVIRFFILIHITVLLLKRGAEGALAPSEFGVSEKSTEREMNSLLLFISTLRFENSTV